MKKKPARIWVYYRISHERVWRANRFTDWYDFADWVKQVNAGNKDITIREWRYE